MSTRILITTDTKKNSISVFYLDPIFLVICDRSEFSELKSIDESQKPGIYILLSSNKRYVGQASGSILSRLEQHNINKDWWNKVIFFGREDSHLSKSQLDYMEKALIQKFNNLNICLDNGTIGNDSYIHEVEQIQADKILKQNDILLKKYTHIKLYKHSNSKNRTTRIKKERKNYNTKTNKRNVESNNTVTKNVKKHNSKLKYAELLGIKIYGFSNINVLLNVLTYLIRHGYINKLSKFISNEPKPTSTRFIGKQPRTSKKGNILTKYIDHTDYYIYAKYSKKQIIEILQDIAKTINEEININIDKKSRE